MGQTLCQVQLFHIPLGREEDGMALGRREKAPGYVSLNEDMYLFYRHATGCWLGLVSEDNALLPFDFYLPQA
jgi:hypothetical protein